MLLRDPEMTSQVQLLSQMVYSYMCIVDKTVHDLTPKYTMLLLVKHVSTIYNL